MNLEKLGYHFCNTNGAKRTFETKSAQPTAHHHRTTTAPPPHHHLATTAPPPHHHRTTDALEGYEPPPEGGEGVF
jgi:hypothetical protein